MHRTTVNPLTFIVVTAGLLRLFIAWAPIEWLMRFVLSDDAFYYFAIARNIVDGHGISFDRIAETNGFHPLWMIVHLAVQSLVDEPSLAIHILLTVAAVIDTFTLSLIPTLLSDVHYRIQIVCCAVYAYSPILFSHVGALSGLETPLNLLLLTLFLTYYRDAISRATLTLRAAIKLGVFSALLFLVRTDNAIVLAVTLTHVVVILGRDKVMQRRIGFSILLFLVAIAPWLIWSVTRFGSLIQVSGLSTAYVARATLAAEGWGWYDYFTQVIRNLAGIAVHFPVYLYNPPTTLQVIMTVAGIFFLASCAMPIMRHRPSRSVKHLHSILPLLVAVVLFVVVQTLRAAYMRGWYYSALYPILILLAGHVMKSVFDQYTFSRSSFFIAAICCLLVVCIGTFRAFTKAPGELNKFQLVHRLNQEFPENIVIGSWNAGIYGYFFQRGKVVNLDGLVNNVAYSHIPERSLRKYCESVGVTHLVDAPGSIRYWMPFWSEDGTGPFPRGDIVSEFKGAAKDTIVVLCLK